MAFVHPITSIFELKKKCIIFPYGLSQIRISKTIFENARSNPDRDFSAECFMPSIWDFVQYDDKLCNSASKNTNKIFECNKCHTMVNRGYRNNKDNEFLCSVCFKKYRFNN